MKTLIQFTRGSNLKGLEVFDSSDWRHLAKEAGPVPASGRGRTVDGLEDRPSYINRLFVQGVSFVGYDHYAVEHLPDGRCKVYGWRDDPEDIGTGFPDENFAFVWEFKPLRPDFRFGGAYRAHQTRTIYTGPRLGSHYDALGPVQNTVILPWKEFVPPPEDLTLHGIWVPDMLMEEHDEVLRPVSWREWTEGVPSEMIVGGRLIPQRPLGLYDKPHGTKTFFQRDTDALIDFAVADHENALSAIAGAGEQEISASLSSPADRQLFAFISISEPNSTQWPTGNYRTQLDVATVGSTMSYGLRNAGTTPSLGGFFRTTFTGATSLEQKQQIEALFIGATLQLATTGSVSWAAGLTDERYAIVVAAARSSSHGNETITLNYDADAFTDGPWTTTTTVTKTVGATAVLKKSNIVLVSGNTVLRSTESKIVAANATLKGTAVTVVGTDALLASKISLTVGAAAVLKKFDTVLVNGTAVLRSSEFKVVSVDSTLKGAAATVVGTDALLFSGASLSVGTTAVLKQGVEVSTGGSSVLKGTEVLATNINSVLRKIESVITSTDSILRGIEVLVIGTTSVLQAQGVVVSASADSVLLGVGGVVTSAEAALQKVVTTAVGVSAEIVSRQIAVPSADIQAGGWTPSTGIDLFPMVADGSDTTWIQSPSAPVNDTAELQLEAISTPEVGQVFLVIRHQLITV